jgi:hypothetical protein
MEKEIKVMETRTVEQYGQKLVYDQNDNLIYADWGHDGSYSKRTYNEQNEIIFDEGIAEYKGKKGYKPYWLKWERYYNADGSKEVYYNDNSGCWYETRINKCGRTIDFVNNYLAKAKDVKFKGERYIYGEVIPC